MSRVRFAIGGLLLAALLATVAAAEEPARKPNFVFILVDDMGWSDASCYGSTFHETPAIDRLAQDGLRFTDGYAACPVCSPTRASILTGKYPARLRLTNYLVGNYWPRKSTLSPVKWVHAMPPAEFTLAEALKSAGYATGHIGKWHLGEGREHAPENQGFDVNIGGDRRGHPRSFFSPQWGKEPPIAAPKGAYLTDVLTEHALAFVTRHKDEPFFLHLSHFGVHTPIEAKPEYVGKYCARIKPDSPQKNPIYAAMVQSVDDSVRRIMARLEELGIDRHTVVIFTSDNGGLSTWEGPNTPATSNHPLRGGKGHLHEGGIREPWIVKWPGVTKPGATCSEPVISVDFFPTILEMAGVPAPDGQALDGKSIIPLLRGASTWNRDAIYWHYPHYSNQGGRPGGAIRSGNHKLIEFYETGKLELYDLEQDPGERNNLADARPRLAADLQRRLEAWRRGLKAQMPGRRTNP